MQRFKVRIRGMMVALLAAALPACHHVPVPAERAAAAQALAAGAGLAPLALPPAPLPLYGFARQGCAGGELAVYIEGDGYAWVSVSQPSPDPTPVNPVALSLATLDPTCNLVYLGRPGQYRASGVDRRYWLEARFAPAVVDSYVAGVLALRRESRAPVVHLAGFSGGGAVAALVAARLAREGVPVTLRTVAGNLDPDTWTTRKRLSPLTASLNPVSEAATLARVPQHHLAGRQDRQVPPAVLEAYLARLPARDCVQVVTVEAGHAGPWSEAWRAALAQRPACAATAGSSVAPRESR